MRHDPQFIAHIAATLLGQSPTAEPHHIRAAVSVARALVDEVARTQPPDEAPSEPPNPPDADVPGDDDTEKHE